MVLFWLLVKSRGSESFMNVSGGGFVVLMARFFEIIRDAPIHAGGKVILKMLAPPPDGGVDAGFGAAVVVARHGVAGVESAGPELALFAPRLPFLVASAPTAVVRTHAPAQA